MQKADPNLALRLALSHRAKAREGLAQCKRDLAAGRLDKNSHDLQVAELEHELARAEATVRKLRDAERASIVRLEANLRLLREEQEDLPNAVKRGTISASGANDANRSLRRRITALQEGVTAVKARLSAEHPEELGGRIDLPFEKYQGEVPYTPKPVGTMEWVLALLLSIVAAASIFLPWVRVEDVDRSLVGLAGGSLPTSLHLLWLPLFVLPFASIPIVAIRKKGLVGWGILFLGVLVTTAGMLPSPLANRGSLFGLAPSELLQLFRPGSILYCAVGVAFIVMGGLRVGDVSIALKRRLAAVAAFAAVMTLAVLGVMAAIYASSGGARVTFDASLVLPAQDAIRVVCRSEGGEAVDVYTSWSARPASRGGGHEAGVDVYVKERGTSEYRMLPNTEAAWSTAGLPGEGEGSFRVSPASSLELTLDLRRLTALGANAESIRLAFYSDSRELMPFETNLGAAYLSPPAKVEPRAADPGPAVAAKPQKTSVSAPAPPQPQKQAPAPVAQLLVSFVGTMGEKAVLKLVRGGAAEERVTAAVGDLLDKDWTVAKIDRAPSAVTLINVTQNVERIIRRGETVNLNAGP